MYLLIVAQGWLCFCTSTTFHEPLLAYIALAISPQSTPMAGPVFQFSFLGLHCNHHHQNWASVTQESLEIHAHAYVCIQNSIACHELQRCANTKALCSRPCVLTYVCSFSTTNGMLPPCVAHCWHCTTTLQRTACRHVDTRRDVCGLQRKA